jgi:NADP-dependent 3-hydroxy acid dehydrogenase YdfG
MDIFSLRGKVAALSGASTGIGRHMAGTLAAAGAKVVLGARTVSKLDERVAEIRAAGGEAYAAPSMFPICRA